MKVFRIPLEFEWDNGNRDKNFIKHKVMDSECEEVLFDHLKKMLNDLLHSGSEERYVVIGKTKNKRLLFIVFTMRKHKIRVLSARDLNRKERHLYEEET